MFSRFIFLKLFFTNDLGVRVSNNHVIRCILIVIKHKANTVGMKLYSKYRKKSCSYTVYSIVPKGLES